MNHREQYFDNRKKLLRTGKLTGTAHNPVTHSTAGSSITVCEECGATGDALEEDNCHPQPPGGWDEKGQPIQKPHKNRKGPVRAS